MRREGKESRCPRLLNNIFKTFTQRYEIITSLLSACATVPDADTHHSSWCWHHSLKTVWCDLQSVLCAGKSRAENILTVLQPKFQFQPESSLHPFSVHFCWVVYTLFGFFVFKDLHAKSNNVMFGLIYCTKVWLIVLYFYFQFHWCVFNLSTFKLIYVMFLFLFYFFL